MPSRYLPAECVWTLVVGVERLWRFAGLSRWAHSFLSARINDSSVVSRLDHRNIAVFDMVFWFGNVAKHSKICIVDGDENS